MLACVCSAKSLSKYTDAVDGITRDARDRLAAATDAARTRLKVGEVARLPDDTRFLRACSSLERVRVSPVHVVSACVYLTPGHMACVRVCRLATLPVCACVYVCMCRPAMCPMFTCVHACARVCVCVTRPHGLRVCVLRRLGVELRTCADLHTCTRMLRVCLYTNARDGAARDASGSRKKHTRTHTHMHTHARTQTHTRTRTHTRAHTHTHTRTRTHTRARAHQSWAYRTSVF